MAKWLDKYEDGGEYLGTTNKGFNYNGAWGGPSMQMGGTLQPPMAGAIQTVPMAQMGGYVYPTTFVPQAQNGYVKNNLLNRLFNKKNILEYQILEENKALKNVAPLRKFHVDYANSQDSETLKSLHHNPEYISPEEGLFTETFGNITIPKGKMLVNDDPSNPQFINVKHPGKYSTLINKEGLSNAQIKDLATNDFISHALHADAKYNELSNQLKTSLLSKYSEEMLENNGGVDAYVRGIFSNDPEYKPYKDEMQGVVSPELISDIKSYIKTGKYAMGGSIPGSVGFTYARTQGIPSEGPYGKKTVPSAQNGQEMQFYQNGLDWTPRNISKNGSEIPKAQPGITEPLRGDIQMRGNVNILTQMAYDASKARQAQAAEQAAREATTIGPDIRTAAQKAKDAQYAAEINKRRKDLGFIEGTGHTQQAIERDRAKAERIIHNLVDVPSTIMGAGELAYLGGKGLAKVAPKVGEYLTTQTPLRNAYKINPWAFKTQKGKIYRQVGQPGFDDAITEGKIFDKGQKQFLEANPEINYLDEYNEAINHSNSILKGLNLKKPSPAPFFSKDELFFPINRKATGIGNKKTKFSDAEYLFEGSVPEEALLPRYRDTYLKPTEATTNTFVLGPEYNDLSNFNLYKRDWLRGYKEVPKPKSSIASELNSLTANINPKNLKSQSGLNWMQQWYNDPMFIERYGPTGEYTAESMQRNILNDLNEYQPKNYLDLLKDKGLGQYVNSSIGSAGVSWGTPESIYVNRTMYAPFNKKGLESTRVHELTHMIENNGYYLSKADEKALLKPFNISNKESIPKNPGFFRREMLGDRPEYYLDPTEIHARMNEARFHLGLSPKDQFTSEMFDYISKNKNWYGMNKYIKDKKSFIDLMNKFWAVPATGVAGASFLKKEQEVPQQKKGGVVKDNMGYWNPDNWGKVVEIDSPNITMKGVNQDLIGVSDTGDIQYMTSGNDYTFDGNRVTEYPVAKYGVNQQDEKTVQHLDQLLNFTNKPKAKNGWLSKYE